jgi:hypothetical protein
MVYLQVILHRGTYLLEMELLQFLLPSTIQEFKPGQLQLSPNLLLFSRFRRILMMCTIAQMLRIVGRSLMELFLSWRRQN